MNNDDERDYEEESDNRREMEQEDRNEHCDENGHSWVFGVNGPMYSKTCEYCGKVVECDHVWTTGMMYVHDEDLDEIARMRAELGESPPECQNCETKYELPKPDKEQETPLYASIPDPWGNG